MAEDRFEIWLDQARAARLGGLWRILVGFLLALAGALLGAFLTLHLAAAILRALLTPEGLAAEEFLQIAALLLSNLSFWIAVALVRRGLHGLPFSSLWGWRGRLEWRPFWGGVCCSLSGYLLMFTGFLLYGLIFGETAPLQTEAGLTTLPTRPDLSFQILLTLLLLAPLIFLQAGGEEALFRGHMLQMLAARHRSAIWLWAGLPSLLFGLLHMANSGMSAPLEIMALHVSSTGILALLTTRMTRAEGGISAAIGFHLLNNYMVFALFLLNGALGSVFEGYAAQEERGALTTTATLVFYHLCCVATFYAPWPPFGRWIGLRR